MHLALGVPLLQIHQESCAFMLKAVSANCSIYRLSGLDFWDGKKGDEVFISLFAAADSFGPTGENERWLLGQPRCAPKRNP